MDFSRSINSDFLYSYSGVKKLGREGNAVIARIHKACAGDRSSSGYRAGWEIPKDSGDRHREELRV